MTADTTPALLPESEALLDAIATNERLSPTGARMTSYREALAAIEAATVARHVRETGCQCFRFLATGRED